MIALIIDDSSTMRLIIGRALAKLGFRVVEANDGRSGLEMLRRVWPVDVVLVDWNMPEMDGLQFVQLARKDPRWNRVPLVMITTNAQIANVVSALDAGASEYLMKPFTNEMIEDKLKILGVLK